VHRDIKPANLMVCERGGIADFVKVLDFGLVKDVKHAPANSLAGTIVGTPHYMAPEIVLGTGASAATDLYALGAVAYYMLTATEVFPDRALLAVLAQHVSAPPVPPSERLTTAVPPQLEALVLRCLEKRAEQRFASARELQRALERLLSEGHVATWRQEEARAFWAEHQSSLQSSLEEEASSGATPWGETLIVDLDERGTSRAGLAESGRIRPGRAGS
jgi:serine/threonine-protein kinase